MSKGIDLSKTVLDSFVGEWGEQYTMVLQTRDTVTLPNPNRRWWQFWEPKTITESVYVDVMALPTHTKRIGPGQLDFEPVSFGPLPRTLGPDTRVRLDGYTGVGLATFPVECHLMPVNAGDTLDLSPHMELR